MARKKQFSLNPDDYANNFAFLRAITQHYLKGKPKRVAWRTICKMQRDYMSRIYEAGNSILDRLQYREDRNACKRFAERDNEIVRLSEVEHLTDGQICERIKGRWPLNQNKQPITSAMVGAARRRRQEELSSSFRT